MNRILLIGIRSAKPPQHHAASIFSGWIMLRKLPRPVYKPHSVRQANLPRRSSILARRLRLARAAYPELTETSSLPGRNAHLSLLGLAPDGGCLAAPVARRAGGLLHHLFTLTGSSLQMEAPLAVFLCGPIRQVTGARPAPAPGVARHRALRSADFPLHSCEQPYSNRPTDLVF